MRHRRFTQVFVAAMLSLLAVVVAGGIGAGARPRHASAAAPSTPIWFLYMNGVYAATLRNVAGCMSFADVDDLGGGDHGLNPYRQTAPCVVQHGLATATFESWLSRELAGGGASIRSTFQIAMGDALTPHLAAEVEITAPVLKEFRVPGVDAASGAPIFFTSTIGGETIRPVTPIDVAYPTNAPRPPRLSNPYFKFSLGGVKQTGVNQTSPFDFKRGDGPRPGAFSFGKYVVVTGWSKQGDFPGWYEESVLTGDGPFTQERGATLELLTANLATTLVTLDMPAVGVFRTDSGLDPSGRDWSMYVDAATVAFN
jgi:hypothetical protein